MERDILREEYVSRINKVQDYIEKNISEEFSLIHLSKVANFSPYHFHRIFASMTGETLFQYIQRIRLEKSALMLLANKKAPITELALKCGFSNQASFAKAFKKNFNMSASKYRESNMGKVIDEITCYNGNIGNKQHLKRQEAKETSYMVEVKNIQGIHVAYIRYTGPYKGDAVLFEELYKRLYNWASEKNLVNIKKTKWLTLCHDEPDITEETKLRISFAITIEKDVKVDGEIGKLKISGGRYAVGHFQLRDDQYEEAWNKLFVEWLPESGYQLDDGLCFELYPSKEKDDSCNQMVDIYIPIKPL